MKEFLIFALIAILLIAGVIALAGQYDRIQCDALTAQIGYPHKWSFMTSCMIEIKDGQWIPLKNWRVLNP